MSVETDKYENDKCESDVFNDVWDYMDYKKDSELFYNINYIKMVNFFTTYVVGYKEDKQWGEEEDDEEEEFYP
tara:strand:- start:246 stop:464 length:219 start_codon:yes stop_codon:yes gene_type:complete